LRVRSPVLQFQGRYRGYENRKGRGRGGDEITSSRSTPTFIASTSRSSLTSKVLGRDSLRLTKRALRLSMATSRVQYHMQTALVRSPSERPPHNFARSWRQIWGRAGPPKSPGARNSFSLAVQPALGLCSSQVGCMTFDSESEPLFVT
jgi:hypothetical protein